MSYFVFPTTRLKIAGDGDGTDIDHVQPEAVNPSPHHDRAFHAAANAAFIAAVRAAGTVGPLTVRETPDGLELLDVHKGAWVARRAGLDAVAVRILDLDAEAYARPTARIKPTSIAGREVHELLAVSINISVGEYIRI